MIGGLCGAEFRSYPADPPRSERRAPSRLGRAFGTVRVRALGGGVGIRARQPVLGRGPDDAPREGPRRPESPRDAPGEDDRLERIPQDDEREEKADRGRPTDAWCADRYPAGLASCACRFDLTA